MTYAGSLPQGQPPFAGQPQAQPPRQQQQQPQFAPQTGYQGHQSHQGHHQAFQHQPQHQAYAIPSQQLPYDYNNYAHLQQPALPPPQQQHGQTQWGLYDSGGFGNTGGMHLAATEQYMAPADVWQQNQRRQPQQQPIQQRHQQQAFHVPSPQMAQPMAAQSPFQAQNQPSPQQMPQQMPHLQHQPSQRSPSIQQQRPHQQQHRPSTLQHQPGLPQLQNQPHPPPSLPQQQQYSASPAQAQFQSQPQPQRQPQPQQHYRPQQGQQQQGQQHPGQQQQGQQHPGQQHPGQQHPGQQHPGQQHPGQQHQGQQHQGQQHQGQHQGRQHQGQLQAQPSPSIQQQQCFSPAPQQPQEHAQVNVQPRQQQAQAHPQAPQAPTQAKTQAQQQARPLSHPQPQPSPQPSRQTQAQADPPVQQFQAPSEDQHMQFVNLQDIQQMPLQIPPAMGNAQSNAVPKTQPALQPAPVLEKSPSATPGMSNVPPAKREPLGTQQSPRVSASKSPATPAGRISTKSSPAAPKASPYNTTQMMVAVAEELVENARTAAPGIALEMSPDQLEEYQKLIATGLACLEGALQSQRLSPRQEARVRLRYAAILQEETENIMEAETTLSKGITLCDKHRMLDLKYCMQYLMMKALFQRNRKAALKALDQHIADSDAYQHVHWAYAFRLLKASFYMEAGTAADATALENIRTIQSMAATRGDVAVSVYASLSEALILLKTSRGTPVATQTCMAQASKYQLDPKVNIPQLQLLFLLVDYLSSLHRDKHDAVVDKLRALQKKIDEYQNLAAKPEFFLPIRKQPSTAQTVGSDVSAIIRPGNDESESDYLVMSFVSHMELMALVFTMGGLTYLHKPSGKASSADLWSQGLKILDFWNHSKSGTADSGPLPLGQAITQKEWRADLQCYLNLLLGLLAASQCSWDATRHHLMTAESVRPPPTLPDMMGTFFIYLKGVYSQGIGDFDNALAYFQDEALSLDVASPKQSQRHVAILAAMNRLWIMQRPSHQNDPVTMQLLNELEPLCRDHENIEIRGTWSGVMATVVTNPPRQRNQRKEDAGRALKDVRQSSNTLAATIGLVIARDLLYNNVLGDQALKCMQAASHWGSKSCNPLWQSVVDGIMADFSDARNEKENAKKYWDKGVQEAKLAFARSS